MECSANHRVAEPGLKMAGGMELRKAEELFQRLQKLSCLPVKGLYMSEPENIHEFLCTPSVIRLGILEWLCTRIYPPLQEQFSTLKESEGEEKIKEMAKLGFELMLCPDEDVDLIKGNAPSSKQLLFIGRLLDILQTSPNISRDLGLESSSQYIGETFVNYTYDNEDLLGELFSCLDFQEILTPECNPWPADLQPLLLKEELPESSLPSDKNNAIGEHLEELQKISTALHDLEEECTFIRSSVPGIETITQTLKLALTDFHQLIGAFNQVYENEFQEHCGPKTPCLSHCGPFFQSVHCLLSSCSKELEAIDQFTATSNTITEVVSKKEQFKESWGGGTMETIYEKINEIKQNYEVFLNSLQK